MVADSRRLLRIAERIADDESIDWSGEMASDSETVRTIRRLRQISAIGSSCRQLSEGSLGLTPEEETAPHPQAHPAEPEAPPESWGSLRVHERIGVGSFGEVYRAYDPDLQRDVALKVLRHSAGGRFDEARALARVRHPNVLQVHAVSEQQGRVGIATQLLKGRNLEQLLREQGVYGPDEAAQIGRTICAATAALHDAGLVHCDIKTANIMRESGGHYVLMDFSCATEATESGGSRRVLGTPIFMAPEVLRGKASDERADLYSLGVVLYRLVTGCYPYEVRQLTELLDEDNPPRFVPLRDRRPDLPDAFVDAVEKALEPDPGERYRSAGEMERALAGVQARSQLPWRWLFGVAAAALLAGVVLIGPRLPWFQAGLHGEVSLVKRDVVGETALSPGARLALGDELRLELELSAPAYLYVLNEDQSGEDWLLFPLDSADIDRPLEPRTPLFLPGMESGGPVHWQVTSSGGSERFMVVASRTRLLDLERRLEGVPRASEETAIESEHPFRGIGGISRPGVHSEKLELQELYELLRKRAEKDRGIFTWQMTLENPAE